MSRAEEVISVHGARVHNLQQLDVDIPRNKLVVITGLSGSGKSSLAFDTIYAEGQRRYLETFSAYIRQYIGKLVRPDVDDIQGLSPVISIEQKTVNRSPRSTVGTVTEIYDIMRLLFARASVAISPVTGEPMVRFSDEEIMARILTDYKSKKLMILAPVIRGRKGHYRDFFEQITHQGFVRVRVDGEIRVIVDNMQLDRYKTHDVEIVVDRIEVLPSATDRIRSAVRLAMKYGKGVLMILEHEHTKPRFFSRHYMCPVSGISYEEPAPNLFSFNSPYGACKRCNGLGVVYEPDLDKIVPDTSKSIASGAIAPLGRHDTTWTFARLEALGHKYGFTMKTPWKNIPQQGVQAILNGTNETIEVNNKRLGLTQSVHVSFDGIFSLLEEAGAANGRSRQKKWSLSFSEKITCPRCKGGRLKEEALHFKINNMDIAQLAAMDIRDLGHWFDAIEKHLDGKQQVIAKEPVKEIRARIDFLRQVGIDYLSLNRGSRTLSGGEAQRIRLATQIGSELVGVLYILDEPSIGLHQRDNARLIDALMRLRDQNNSVIVVEHDREIMEKSDYIIDMGPGAGARGGRVVAAGAPKDFVQFDVSTAQYLGGKKRIDIPAKRRKGNNKKLSIKGATGNNLKAVDLSFPLGCFICVTGVSGSGKSTLLNQTLMPALKQKLYRSEKPALPYQSISGIEHIDKLIDIDQSPIGRTPRSNPATYTAVFSDIRYLFSMLPDAKARGYKPGRFSFNVKGGRCETCFGAGLRVIEMNFLPDVHVPCEECGGHRYNRETLEIRYKGKNIEDVLNMTVSRALDFFSQVPAIKRKIQMLEDVGLGYLKLGQSAVTLSGGEAQRVKLSNELSRRATGKSLYVLDEPTTGLHFDDIRMLLKVLDKLVDQGNTVMVIEHNMDVIKCADYIIDLGPENGAAGGYVVATGTPEQIVEKGKGHTASWLSRELNRKPNKRNKTSGRSAG